MEQLTITIFTKFVEQTADIIEQLKSDILEQLKLDLAQLEIKFQLSVVDIEQNLELVTEKNIIFDPTITIQLTSSKENRFVGKDYLKIENLLPMLTHRIESVRSRQCIEQSQDLLEQCHEYFRITHLP